MRCAQTLPTFIRSRIISAQYKRLLSELTSKLSNNGNVRNQTSLEKDISTINMRRLATNVQLGSQLMLLNQVVSCLGVSSLVTRDNDN